MTAHGGVGPVTWRKLLWHYDYPSFSDREPVRLQRRQWSRELGRPARRSASCEAAAHVVRVDAGHGRISVGDAGFEHGGNIPCTRPTRSGLDVDIRPIRDAENQCSGGHELAVSSYDRAAPAPSSRTIRAAAPGHVKLIYFNDPVLIREGLTTALSGHDDHLHIRYCEQVYPLATYRC